MVSEEIPSFNAPQSAAWPTGKIVFTKIPIEPWKCVHDDDEEGDKDADDDSMMIVISFFCRNLFIGEYLITGMINLPRFDTMMIIATMH